MTDSVQTNSSNPIPAAGMRGEIAAKWGKLNASEIAALKTKADLVASVASKYSLDAAKAQSEVDAFAKGRQL